MEWPSSNISNSLSLLEKLEGEHLSSPLKNHILSLKLGLRFLELFINVSSNEDLDLRIKNVVYDVWGELQSLLGRQIAGLGCLILDLEHEYTNLREKMKNVIFKPETRGYDVVFPKLYSWNPFLKTTNDFLLESFRDISSCSNVDIIVPWMKEIDDIKDKLMLLQALLSYVADTEVRIMDKNKKCLTPLVALLDKASCLLYSCLVQKMDEETTQAMKQKLSDLVENTNVEQMYMMVLRASEVFDSTDNPLESGFHLLDNLIKLLDFNMSSVMNLNVPYEKLHRKGSLAPETLVMYEFLERVRPTLSRLPNPSENLHDKLKFLQAFLADLPFEVKVEKFNYLVTSIEAIACNAVTIVSSCYVKDMKDDMAREVDGALSKVIDQIKEIQSEVKEIKLYSYPKTDGLGFMNLFLGYLEELLKSRPEFIEVLKKVIVTLYLEFYFLRSFLRNIKDHEELGDLWTRIIGLAYQAEYIIDFYLVKSVLDSRIRLSLSKIIEQAKLITSEVKMICNGVKYHSHAFGVAKSSSHVASKAIDTTTDEVVGRQDEVEKIMEYLVGAPYQLEVISIVGMPGLGKTTLAKKMYKTPLIIERFDVRAWCYVSQTYQRRNLFLTILHDVIRVTNDIKKLNDEELAAQLYRSLKGRRYLIVLDDIWDIKAWNDLARSLPNDKNGSRILVTSRLDTVASQFKAGSKVHHLRQFSGDESWELFQKKLSEKEGFSENLLEVGKQIVENCNGLPLSVVVMAGLLAKLEKSEDKWNQVAASLNSHIFSDSESQCIDILGLSYNHLPNYLKSCFLYIGAFPEGKQIPVWKLKWLWIAEGFVQNIDTKSLEDVAEMYVMDLIGRSLLIAAAGRSCGGVKACYFHDLFRDFCLKKAKEEHFLQVIHQDHWPTNVGVYEQRRLSIHSSVYHLLNAEPFGCSVRSLLHTAAMENYTFYPGDVSFIFQNFKLLRVLDLAYINIIKSFRGIESLIHLRYLAVGARITSFPPSITKLWNLQTFIVRANNFYQDIEMVEVPDSLWDMVNLRHVHINHRAIFNVHDDRLKNSVLLENLETLSTPCFGHKDDADNLLRRLPKLRKLRCVFVSLWNLPMDWGDCVYYPAMDFLDQLVSLKVILMGELHHGRRCEFNFPSNLKKLTLSWCGLRWDNISEIGKTLPKLEVLKVIGQDWDETWVVDDGDFPKLKYLKLSRLLNLREWIASEDSFPILEQLVVEDCRNLNEIPLCFGGIPTLRMVAVVYCQPSVNDSVREIEMTQKEEWQNEELAVFICPREQEYNDRDNNRAKSRDSDSDSD